MKIKFVIALLAVCAFSFQVKAQNKDIVDLAVGNKNLSTLVAAVKAAGLVNTLKGNGPFTVFAPTNDAFAALPKGTVENLLKPENKKALVKVLTYHVVAAKAMAGDLKNGKQMVGSVEGEKITVVKRNGKVMVNGAEVVIADVKAKNGVVHVINKVILPPSMSKSK
ncbi:MAG TPA: fasciclin [Microscillaceae bacterium]|nr:fasciclin [Microscillaceae bacterium]